MTPHHGLAERRTQLALLARRRSRRRTLSPHEWHPHTVPNPTDGNQPFTNAGAWEFVADLLEDVNQVVTTITLNHPAGEIGYVMDYPLPGGGRLYIKVHFGHGHIVGRSFHYSDYSE